MFDYNAIKNDIIASIEDGGNACEGEYDIEAIIDRIRDIEPDAQGIDDVDPDTYWNIVANNAY